MWLDASLAQLSDILVERGTGEGANERRATALGIPATRARALAPIQEHVVMSTPPSALPLSVPTRLLSRLCRGPCSSRWPVRQAVAIGRCGERIES